LVHFHFQAWEWKTPTLLDYLHRANLNPWTKRVTMTAVVWLPQTRLCLGEITDKKLKKKNKAISITGLGVL
jgi:hypothetical protein